MSKELREEYVVRGIIAETPDVVTLLLSHRDGTIPRYVSGQYVTVYFPELGTPEGKAYSISSEPHEKTLNVTVKRMGAFSNRLCSLNVGDIVTASLPYGYFYSESGKSSLVLVCAGIGVTPFRSMVLDTLRKNPRRNIALLCSYRTTQDIIFGEIFNELWAMHENLRITYFITREENIPQTMIHGRIRAHTILKTVKNFSNLEFLLCGSISFVRDIWRDLRDSGISEEALYTEAFFSH